MGGNKGDILGVRIGDMMNDAIKKIEGHGFKKVGKDIDRYKKGTVSISLSFKYFGDEADQATVESMHIDSYEMKKLFGKQKVY